MTWLGSLLGLLRCLFAARSPGETANEVEQLEPEALLPRLRFAEWEGLSNCVHDAKQPAEPARVATAAVHAHAHSETFDLALGIPHDRYALGWHLERPAGRLDGASSKRAGEGAGGSADVPDAPGLERVRPEAVEARTEVWKGIFDVEAAHSFQVGILAEWSNDRADELEVFGKPVPEMGMRD